MQFPISTIIVSLLTLGANALPVTHRAVVARDNSTVVNSTSSTSNGQNLAISNPNQLAALLSSQSNGESIDLNNAGELAQLLGSQQSNYLNANNIVQLLSNSENNIESLNGLDVSFLLTFTHSF